MAIRNEIHVTSGQTETIHIEGHCLILNSEAHSLKYLSKKYNGHKTSAFKQKPQTHTGH